MQQLNTGQFIGSKSSQRGTMAIRAHAPGTRQSLDPAFFEATDQEVDAACNAAWSAFPVYRKVPLAVRARFLSQIAEALELYADEFTCAIPEETGLPEARARGELNRTAAQLRLFAEVIRKGDFLGVRIDAADSAQGAPDVRQYKVPLGPVAVFTVSNFPLAFSVAGGDTASALAAGCPVVVKAHPAHPRTSALAATAICEVIGKMPDIPDGTFSMLQGASLEVGQRLVRHPAIKAVGFTGSYRGGTALSQIAAERDEPIPVYAEMGSLNPLFLFPEALRDRGEAIAEGFVDSMNLACGQFCTKPGLIFAASGDQLDLFLKHVAEQVSKRAAGAMLTPGILDAFNQGLGRFDTLSNVKRVSAGSKEAEHAQSRVYRTDLKTLQENPDLREEVFGPVALVVEVEDVGRFADTTRFFGGQLTVSVHASPDELKGHREFIERLEAKAGRLVFGGFPTGVRVCHAMVHGGPYPATTSQYGMTTSVGTLAIERFLRPVCYQNFPDALLPEVMRDTNPGNLRRLVNGNWS